VDPAGEGGSPAGLGGPAVDADDDERPLGGEFAEPGVEVVALSSVGGTGRG